ncbi:hypothetical protein CRE_16187 [Caenorhabditis remanei]|uniref:F-box domain-containing protein n=1 Tax=Caenorhabditis remanei TaxID=31234 RepID=E3MSH1_CAERE|nr:hypothetical protein CRE_16187 [Caenorhabditis remanei]
MTSSLQRPSHNFPLLKLPYLAMENVFSCMTHLELVDISLCSKKCKNLVKSGRKRPWTYMDIELNWIQLQIYLYDANDEDIVSVWDFSKRVVRNRKSVQWWKLNELEGYTKKQRGNERHYQCTTKQPLEISTATVISYFFELFPDCYVKNMTLQFMYNDSQCLLPVLAAVKTVENLKTHNYDRIDHIKNILPHVTITKAFQTNYNVCKNPLVLESLACTEIIYCDNARWLSPETFMTLNCKLVGLMKARLTVEDIMRYFKKWKNSTGDEMNRLQHMYIISEDIEIGQGVFNALKELGATAWDPVKRARYFKYPEGDFIDCQTGMDIERTDGLLASIMVPTKKKVSIIVWKDRFPEQHIRQ